LNGGSQQQNFQEIVQKMADIPGWGILEDGELLALVAPSAINFVNFVWGNPSFVNIEKVKSFYTCKPYTWLTTPDTNSFNLQQAGFVCEEDVSTEMVLDLGNYVVPSVSSNIEIIIPNSDIELQVWAETAATTFGCSDAEFKEFFYPLIRFAQCVPFLLTYANQPAGTAMVYCGHKAAGIYAMSTIEKYRRKGCATAAVNACIALAKTKHLRHAVLYASTLGRPVYEKLGFNKVTTLPEWHFAKI
jgi:GNAT superfamily N-acetyltransferase